LTFAALFGALLRRMAYIEPLCVAEPSPSANLTLLTGLPAFDVCRDPGPLRQNPPSFGEMETT